MKFPIMLQYHIKVLDGNISIMLQKFTVILLSYTYDLLEFTRI